MKKELFALALLLALFAGGLWNTHYLRSLTEELNGELKLSQAYCENGEYALALESAESAQEMWTQHKLYAGIFIRHSEIDTVGDSFYALTGALESDEPASAGAEYEGLMAHIASLYDMERLAAGSIF